MIDIGYNPNVIIITEIDRSEYLLTSFELGCIDYILKPVCITRLEKAIKKAMSIVRNKRSLSLNFPSKPFMISIINNHKKISINVSDLIYPFYFFGDWIDHYHANGMDWRLLNSMKLTFFNFILLLPLGVYLVVIFGIKNMKSAITILFLTTLLIESYQVLFSYFGLIRSRIFDVDDIMLNSLGGMLGFLITLLSVKVINKRRVNPGKPIKSLFMCKFPQLDLLT